MEAVQVNDQTYRRSIVVVLTDHDSGMSYRAIKMQLQHKHVKNLGGCIIRRALHELRRRGCVHEELRDGHLYYRLAVKR